MLISKLRDSYPFNQEYMKTLWYWSFLWRRIWIWNNTSLYKKASLTKKQHQTNGLLFKVSVGVFS